MKDLRVIAYGSYGIVRVLQCILYRLLLYSIMALCSNPKIRKNILHASLWPYVWTIIIPNAIVYMCYH